MQKKYNYDQEEIISYIRSWVPYFSGSDTLPESQQDRVETINEFWVSYFSELLNKENGQIYKDTESPSNEIVDFDTRTIKVPKSLFVREYKDRVYKLLEENKNEKDPNKLKALQEEIEDLTMNFSESNMFKTCPNIMSILTKTNKPNAKEFLRGKYKLDDLGRMQIINDNENQSIEEKKKYENILDSKDQDLLKEFGDHTLECLLVHTLSYLFNIENSVSLASLIDRIESGVRQHAKFLKSKHQNVIDNLELSKELYKKKMRSYPFGTALVEFLVYRKLIVITQRYTDDIITINEDDSIPSKFIKRSSKKGKYYYREKYNYVECTFNTALLPIKLNLPMIYPPSDWTLHYDSNDIKEKKRVMTLSYIYGGYLSNPSGQIFENHRAISTPNHDNFYIYFDNDILSYDNNRQDNSLSNIQKAEKLCSAINGLQRQAFRINSVHLNNILKNKELLEKYGLLMPNFLSELKLNEACDILREVYIREEKKDIRSIYGYSELVTILSTNMQRSQYEQTIIQLSKAYEGYSIYYPAFLDFRGRVYRSGIFHFHERDFARSLILIENNEIDDSDSLINNNYYFKKYMIATAFLYKKFKKESEALSFIKERIDIIMNKIDSISDHDKFQKEIYNFFINESKGAKRLFQYISNLYLLIEYYYYRDKNNNYISVFDTVPVTQDASASAYQIMAYFLLDETLAKRTNLISDNNTIEDIYDFFREECLQYIHTKCENILLCNTIDRILTRNIVKKIFMPIIYGKTINSTINDLIILLGKDLLAKECVLLAKLCFAFWHDKYNNMNSFIDLISLVGRVCSSLERAVLFNTKYFDTHQDYKKMESCSVRVFDKINRKNRTVNLSVPSDVRDKRKTRAATFVNFIHQRDAQIAMSVAEKACQFNIPLYTVHDNFISNTKCCITLPKIYREVFQEMEAPMTIINRFIYINLIKPSIMDDLELQNLFMENLEDYRICRADLESILKNQTPILEIKNRRGWSNIIDKLLNQYDLYCLRVGVTDTSLQNHKIKWNNMRYKINGEYSIHH